MVTLKMESQNINHEKWQDKGMREKDQSPQAQLLLNARTYSKARGNEDLQMPLEVDRDLLMSEHFPHEESPRNGRGMSMPPLGDFSSSGQPKPLKPFQQIAKVQSEKKFNLIGANTKRKLHSGSVHFSTNDKHSRAGGSKFDPLSKKNNRLFNVQKTDLNPKYSIATTLDGARDTNQTQRYQRSAVSLQQTPRVNRTEKKAKQKTYTGGERKAKKAEFTDEELHQIKKDKDRIYGKNHLVRVDDQLATHITSYTKTQDDAKNIFNSYQRTFLDLNKELRTDRERIIHL